MAQSSIFVFLESIPLLSNDNLIKEFSAFPNVKTLYFVKI